MIKLKTKKAWTKRIKSTKNEVLLFKGANGSHLSNSKSRKQLKRIRELKFVSSSNKKRFKKYDYILTKSN